MKGICKDVYSPLNPSAQFMIQRRQRLVRAILADAFPSGLENVRLLEVGCGNGQWLAEFAAFGFRFANFAGIDMDAERIRIAKERIPTAELKIGDATELPWPDKSFDIVFQSTLFTSVKNRGKKGKIASEMTRVCRETGFVLWYDFQYDSPSNPDVKGVGREEIRGLFSPWECSIRSVTLAPPIARRLVPVSWSLAEDIETFFPFLRTHLLAKMSPR